MHFAEKGGREESTLSKFGFPKAKRQEREERAIIALAARRVSLLCSAVKCPDKEGSIRFFSWKVCM